MSSISQDGFIPIPREHTIKFTVTINGVTVNNDLIGLKVTRACTTEVHSARVTLENTNNTYSFIGNEAVKVYCDFSAGTTLMFSGVIEKVKSDHRNGHTYELICRHDSAILLDTLVNAVYTNQSVSSIISSILTTYAPTFTGNNVTTTETVTISWNNKSVWDCLVDLAQIEDASFYFDETKNLHFFPRGSILNMLECIVEGDNFIESNGIGDDITEVKNVIKIQGEDGDGNPILYTASDTTSQGIYGVREKAIEDSNINDMATAKDFGDSEAEKTNATDKKGTITSFLLPDMNAGDQIWTDIPTQLIHSKFTIFKLEHDIINDQTVSTVEDLQSLSKFFRDRVKKEKSLEQIKNPNNMKESYNLTFDDETGIETHSGTKIDGGKLVLTVGTQGIMTTSERSVAFNATQYEFRVIGEQLLASEIRVYTDGNNYSDWYNLENYRNTVLTTPTSGSQVRFQVKLTADTNNPNPKLEGICVMVK
jgi:hypothetical protein